MTYPDEETVKATLTKYHPRIRSVVLRAWAEWVAVSECRSAKGFATVLYPRTVANYVFDAIARYALDEFDGDLLVRVIVEAQTVKFCFEEKVIGRFKKGDEANLGQNHPTQAALDYVDPQMTLPGLPPEADKIEFIWIGNDLGTEINKVLVVARDKDRLIWEYEIDDPAEGTGAIPIPAPSTPPDGGDSPLVIPRRKDPKRKGQ